MKRKRKRKKELVSDVISGKLWKLTAIEEGKMREKEGEMEGERWERQEGMQARRFSFSLSNKNKTKRWNRETASKTKRKIKIGNLYQINFLRDTQKLIRQPEIRWLSLSRFSAILDKLTGSLPSSIFSELLAGFLKTWFEYESYFSWSAVVWWPSKILWGSFWGFCAIHFKQIIQFFRKNR